jgi:hypothetical protein
MRIIIEFDEKNTEATGPHETKAADRPPEATNAGAAPASLALSPSPASAPSGDAADAGGAPNQLPDIVEQEAATSTPVPLNGTGVDAGPPPSPLAGMRPAAGKDDMDYGAIVAGTVEEVKERVEQGDLDVDKVIAAEHSGKARVTLLDWLKAFRE